MKRSVCTALSVLLLLAMLCASLAGCKKETPKNPDPGTAATETDTGDGGLDAVDYGGAKLKFLTYKEGDSIATANELDGDFNGGPVEKGVYTRNSVLEEIQCNLHAHGYARKRFQNRGAGRNAFQRRVGGY